MNARMKSIFSVHLLTNVISLVRKTVQESTRIADVISLIFIMMKANEIVNQILDESVQNCPLAPDLIVFAPKKITYLMRIFGNVNIDTRHLPKCQPIVQILAKNGHNAMYLFIVMLF